MRGQGGLPVGFRFERGANRAQAGQVRCLDLQVFFAGAGVLPASRGEFQLTLHGFVACFDKQRYNLFPRLGERYSQRRSCAIKRTVGFHFDLNGFNRRVGNKQG